MAKNQVGRILSQLYTVVGALLRKGIAFEFPTCG